MHPLFVKNLERGPDAPPVNIPSKRRWIRSKETLTAVPCVLKYPHTLLDRHLRTSFVIRGIDRWRQCDVHAQVLGGRPIIPSRRALGFDLVRAARIPRPPAFETIATSPGTRVLDTKSYGVRRDGVKRTEKRWAHGLSVSRLRRGRRMDEPLYDTLYDEPTNTPRELRRTPGTTRTRMSNNLA